MSVNQYNFPTTIKFGPGSVKELPAAIKSVGMTRPLIITDQSVAKMDFFQKVLVMLKEHGVDHAVSARTIGNPVGDHVRQSRADYFSAKADGIIAFGGGAALDVGKAVGVVITNAGDILEFDALSANPLPITKALPPVIAVPTTSGTGSEVGRSSVISDDKTHAKKIIFNGMLMPKMVIADPELTLGLPAKVTAATGFDALTHNIEAFLSKGFHPIADGIALEGLHLIAKSLLRAVQDPKNIEARTDMMAASLMGGVAFQKGLGVTHSCAHALSTVYDLHHGLANSLMLTSCLRFNAETESRKISRMGQTVGLGNAESTSASKFIDWIGKLRTDVGIAAGLKNHGVKEIQPLLDIAVADFCHTENPRSVSRSDFQKLYEDAM